MGMIQTIKSIFNKANPAQELIARDEGSSIYTTQPYSILSAFDQFEVVQNGTTFLVNACSEFNIDIKDTKLSEGIKGLRKQRLNEILNHRPNPYQDIQTFRSQIFMDFILEGNIFLYWDGVSLYHLPASKMVINPDIKTYIANYTYDSQTQFLPKEIIHIQDPGIDSIYRGTSRLVSAMRSVTLLNEMRTFQESFFKNGCIPGLVLETENTLSQPAKDRTISNWVKSYSVRSGGARKPIIIDSGLKVKTISDSKFADLDFENSTQSYERKVLKALGIPPLLFDGGNNANIAPNLRLFYLGTVLPIVRKYTSALEAHFGFDLEVVTGTVSALQPELKEVSQYYSSLVNGGIITPDEAREELRYTKIGGDNDKIRVPANIAGSAVDPSQGGKPKDTTSNQAD
jgi:HK97 family phage portal protein